MECYDGGRLAMTGITLLGSTGSIGQSTLDVVRQRPDAFSIHALVAGRNLELLARQTAEFRPQVVVIADPADVGPFSSLLRDLSVPLPQIEAGPAAYVKAAIASECHFVMSAIVGVAGMEATYEAALAGKRIGLANKETLVAAGELVMNAVKSRNVELLPVDSEHNGAHQCLRAGRRSEVTKLI